MTLLDYLRVFRRQWVVLLVAVLLGLFGGIAVHLLKPAEFTARLTLFVSSQSADVSTTSAYEGAQLSERRVASYVELVGSREVSEGALRLLDRGDDPDEVAARVSASSALESTLIDVSVVDGSPTGAADLANAVGTAFADLVAELERPVAAGSIPPVVVRAVAPAVAPAVSSSPGLAFTMVCGLLLGAAVGAAGALARETLDDSIRSAEELRTITGAAGLGAVPFDAGVPLHPLTVHEDRRSPRSEAFRRLRANLRFVGVDRPRKVVVVSSAMPGEGKSTAVVNLAIAMGSAGQRVLVVDADLHRPAVAGLLGLDGTVGLTSVLTSQFTAEQVIQPWDAGTFDVLPSGPPPPDPSELLASGRMRELLGTLSAEYDMVLVDTPPLLPVSDAVALAPACDGVILVCRSGRTTRAQVSAAAEALRTVSAPVLGTVLTMVSPHEFHGYAAYTAAYRSSGADIAGPPPTGPRDLAEVSPAEPASSAKPGSPAAPEEEPPAAASADAPPVEPGNTSPVEHADPPDPAPAVSSPTSPVAEQDATPTPQNGTAGPGRPPGSSPSGPALRTIPRPSPRLRD